MPSRWQLSQLGPCTRLGNFPDDGMRGEPDGPLTEEELTSVMNAIGGSRRRTNSSTSGEGHWEAEIAITASATAFSFAPFPSGTTWRPVVNAYRCADRFVVYAELAGVSRESVVVDVEPRRLIIRGKRLSPEPLLAPSQSAQLLALEIDHGDFERILDLPAEVNPPSLVTDHLDGLLRIELSLRQ